MPIYHLTPQDLLFFRDSRPMEVSVGSGGHGASWPAPSILYDAIHAAFWRAYPAEQAWEAKHRFGRSSQRDGRRPLTKRFGSLSMAGPFPALAEQWLFPCPADVTRAEPSSLALLHPLQGDIGTSNLPANWLLPLATVSQPTKESPAPWWSKAAFESYLGGSAPGAGLYWPDALFEGEWTIGIGMDAASGTQDGERIYSAEYLRLRQGVQMGVYAEMPLKSDGSEGMTKLIDGSARIVVGGQQRVCLVERKDNLTASAVLPGGLMGGKITGNRVKWVLLSPAVWPSIPERKDSGDLPIQAHPGGWLPNWICPSTGRVLLKAGDTARSEGQSRKDWREHVRALDSFPESTRLVAARVPKPQVITGWSDVLHLDPADESKRAPGPKPTHLAVPAGAVYYFECASAEEARALANTLNWHGAAPGDAIANRRSALLGEKGFGLGVCGTWDPQPAMKP